MKKYRLLFVVHRYHPYPGGSEANTRRIAEEAARQGHDVTVLSHMHKGDINGVKVTSNFDIIWETWDMIWVHGSCTSQDVVLHNIEKLKSPVYYAVIHPNDSPPTHMGLKHAKWIGCGTSFDRAWVEKNGQGHKVRRLHYGLNLDEVTGRLGIVREKYGIATKKIFLSAGGFWPHKRMTKIADAFAEAAPEDTTLVLMGYDTVHGQPPTGFKNVVNIVDPPLEDVYHMMAESSLYILNSEFEGYGLVLLETMWNGCPWISRPIAAGYDLTQMGYGTTFDSQEELVSMLRNSFVSHIFSRAFIQHNYLVEHMLADTLNCLEEFPSLKQEKCPYHNQRIYRSCAWCL